MIEAITGMPGSGKTLYMMDIMIKERKQNIFEKLLGVDNEVIQITNFPVNEELLPNTIVIGNDEIKKLYSWILEKKYFGASIYLDEASILFPAMDYKNIPKDVIIALRQHRHAGYNMYWTAQDTDDVAKGLRTITQFSTEMDGYSLLRFSLYNCYSMKKGKTNYKDRYNRGILVHTKKLYNSYNTHHDIETPDYLDIGAAVVASEVADEEE